MIEKRKKDAERYAILSDAMKAFIEGCSKCDVDCSGTVSKRELKALVDMVRINFDDFLCIFCIIYSIKNVNK